MDERERGVAAEDHAPFAPETIIESARETFDADDRRHPERDAEEKDAQALRSRRAGREWRSAPSAAGRKPEGMPRERSCGNGDRGRFLDPARAHADHAVTTSGERGVVGDEGQRRSMPRGQIEQ